MERSSTLSVLSLAGVFFWACQSHKGSKPATVDAAAGGSAGSTSVSQASGAGVTGSSGGTTGDATNSSRASSGGATGTTGGTTASQSAGTTASQLGGTSAVLRDGGVRGSDGGSPQVDAGLAKDAGPKADGASDAAGDARIISTVPACSPGLTVTEPFTSRSEVACNVYGWELGVPNGEATFAKTFVLPSPLIVGADNALSFELTGSGPYNFELWGTDTVCKADELLWWGPFGAGTQCAQFRPSKPFAYVLFVYREMHAASYSFGTPSETLCPGGTCPGGTTGTGKMSEAPLSAPVGNYKLDRFNPIAGGWEMWLGYLGRMTVAYQGDLKDEGVAQPLAAGVFRMPSTDPYGDAWYCIGEGSTLTQIEEGGWFKGVQFSLRGITRLGDCGDTPGSESLSATISPSPTSRGTFTAVLGGTISSWAGSNVPVVSHVCIGTECAFRFRSTTQEHFVHATVSANPDLDPTNPVAVTSATWLVQADKTKPFSMACSKSGSLLFVASETSKLELAKVSAPRSCPGTPIANDRLDFRADH